MQTVYMQNTSMEQGFCFVCRIISLYWSAIVIGVRLHTSILRIRPVYPPELISILTPQFYYKMYYVSKLIEISVD